MLFVMWPHDFVGVVPLSWVTTLISLGAMGFKEVEIMAFIISVSIPTSVPIPIPMPRPQCQGLQMADNQSPCDVTYMITCDVATLKSSISKNEYWYWDQTRLYKCTSRHSNVQS